MSKRRLSFPDVTWPSTGDGLRHEVRSFLASYAFEPQCDSWLTGFDPEFSRKIAQRGWIGMTWPKALGGHERSALERYVVVEELLAAGAPVAAHWMADRQVGPLLLRHGTPYQRAHFLPMIAAGECYFSIGLSEPDSGSDLASIRTSARRLDNGWRINGSKVWTSHAMDAHYMTTLVRSTASSERHAGLSQLIVDLRSPGVTINPILSLGGEAHFGEVVLDDVFVPREMLVGAEGQGWHQVLTELAFERSGPERILSTFPLLKEVVSLFSASPTENARQQIGGLAARLVALRHLSLGVADAIERGIAPGLEAAVVKDAGTAFEQEVVEVCRNLVTGPGASPSGTVDKLLRTATLAAPGFTLRGGTSEILKGIIARGVTT